MEIDVEERQQELLGECGIVEQVGLCEGQGHIKNGHTSLKRWFSC